MGGLYQYSKLSNDTQEIRLLTILPGEFDDAIHISISCHNLIGRNNIPRNRLSIEELQDTLPDGWRVRLTQEGRYIFTRRDIHYETSWVHPIPGFDISLYEGYSNEPDPEFKPSYEALSYVWGDAVNLQRLKVLESVQPPEKSEITEIMVHQNLASALRHLRNPATPRTLWVDAICINQDDILERSGQVQRMGNIYKLAKRVVIWLGEPSSDSSIAMSAIRYLGGQVEFTTDYSFIRSPDAIERYWFNPSTPLPFLDEVWSALWSLLQNPWFERVWVVQEVALSNRFAIVQCGHDTILWTLFRRAMYCMERKTLPLKPLQKRLESTALLFGKRKWKTSDLLSISRVRKCSDPRDRVFGMLSIAPERFAECIQPDYQLSPLVIYKNAFLVDLGTSKKLKLLRLSFPSSETPDLPTWVPDWASEPPMNVPRRPWRCNASGNTDAQYEYKEPDTLRITGIRVATVCRVSMPIVSFEDLCQLKHDLAANQMAGAKYVTGGLMSDAVLATISMCDLRNRGSRYGWFTLEELRTIFNAGVRSERSIKHIDSLLKWVEGMSFIETIEGHIGLGMPWAKEGDVISIPLGSSTPIILRPHSHFEHVHHVVGDCYLHGVMFGEAFASITVPSNPDIEASTMSPEPWDSISVKESVGFSVNRLDNATRDGEPDQRKASEYVDPMGKKHGA